MVRVKLLKDSKHGKTGEIIFLDNNEAFGLIDSGYAIVTKDIVQSDTKTKASNEVQVDEKELTSKSIKKD